jgi:ribose transport system ATP-binding protein
MPVLKMHDISKSYPGVQALSDVSLVLERGDIHALVGKNGAGKSTLIKVLGGVVAPDSGFIEIDGQPIALGNPTTAIEAGIAIVHQELSLIPNLSVAENISLGHGTSWLVDWKKQDIRAVEMLARLDDSIRPHDIVGQLSVSQQQLVEIAKALTRDPKILVLDEPTSALADGDADRLLDILKGLAAEGVAIIYISHRLSEIERVANRMTVLRDGATITELSMENIDQRQIIELMLGEALSKIAPKSVDIPSDEVVLKVENLSRGTVVRDVSFEVHAGEVLGLAGLVGAGRTELVRLIFGIDKADSGQVLVGGKLVKKPSPRRMVREGIGFLPEDRKHHGLVLGLSVRENLVLTVLDKLSSINVMSRSRETETVNRLIHNLHIVCSSSEVMTGTLSGGNQQKVVVGKWLETDPRLLILDEPTRGIDVKAKAQIFSILERLTSNGVAVIFISSELEEVMLTSHRVLTVANGRIVNETKSSNAELSEILLAATGI